MELLKKALYDTMRYALSICTIVQNIKMTNGDEFID